MNCDKSLDDLYEHLVVFEKIHNKYDIPIMTSHIQFNKISNDPVTTSSTWLKDIPRKVFDKLPYFISDDLEMLGIKKHYPELNRLSILEKTLTSGCSMAIVTTMQDKKIIKEKKSHLFYKNEYLDKLNSHNINTGHINLPCLDDLLYNRGDMNTYREAIEIMGRHIKD
jgi:beta-glucosidase-like glycosyl hydrolase